MKNFIQFFMCDIYDNICKHESFQLLFTADIDLQMESSCLHVRKHLQIYVRL